MRYFCKRLITSLCSILLCSTAGLLPALSWADKQIIGGIEMISLENDSLLMNARIDTGAENCSLHTTNMKFFSRGNRNWVRFTVVGNSLRTKSESYTLEKPIKRFANIKRKGTHSQIRPVIEIPICLGNVQKHVQVNLVDRGKFKFQMLIGRGFLKGAFMVDVDLANTVSPSCGAK